MSFTPTNFQDLPSTATPIDAVELNKLGTQHAAAVADSAAQVPGLVDDALSTDAVIRAAADTAVSDAITAEGGVTDPTIAAALSDTASDSRGVLDATIASESTNSRSSLLSYPVQATRTLNAPTAFNCMSENIIKVGSTYYLLYSESSSGRTALRLATSVAPAGPWAAASSPIISTGDLSWETTFSNGGCILEHEGTFYLYYSCDPSGSLQIPAKIGVATAANVTGPYTKQLLPMLDTGGPGTWDERRVQEPHVAVVDGKWVMAYMAEESAKPQGASEIVGIATADGPFGPWVKSANNPVLGYGHAGAWDEGGTADPSLHYEDGLWWMVYSGLSAGGAQPWRIGLASASNPEGPWVRHPSNPILSNDKGNSVFDSLTVWRGAIFKENGTYYLPYGGIAVGGYSGSAAGGTAILSARPSDTGWVDIPLKAGFVAYSSPDYTPQAQMEGGHIRLRGIVKKSDGSDISPNTTDTVSFGTLPDGFGRTSQRYHFQASTALNLIGGMIAVFGLDLRLMGNAGAKQLSLSAASWADS